MFGSGRASDPRLDVVAPAAPRSRAIQPHELLFRQAGADRVLNTSRSFTSARRRSSIWMMWKPNGVCTTANHALLHTHNLLAKVGSGSTFADGQVALFGAVVVAVFLCQLGERLFASITSS
jgi:hypothetical protein